MHPIGLGHHLSLSFAPEVEQPGNIVATTGCCDPDAAGMSRRDTLLSRLITGVRMRLTQQWLRPRPLYFLHIPKTAGSSVKTWLAAGLGDKLCPVELADQLSSCRLSSLSVTWDLPDIFILTWRLISVEN